MDPLLTVKRPTNPTPAVLSFPLPRCDRHRPVIVAAEGVVGAVARR